MTKTSTKIQFFTRPDLPDDAIALVWRQRITDWLGENYSNIEIVIDQPDVMIVLGGDGTILGAARDHFQEGSIILALNLGTLGFLASIRNQEDFFSGLIKFFDGDYVLKERMMLNAKVMRGDEVVFRSSALNDIVVQNPLSVIELGIQLDGYNYQTSRGTGVLISTATGSTAYNLSAHGPILMSNIKGMIITKLLDHGIPTPGIVVKYTTTIRIVVPPFRKRGLLNITKDGSPADVLIVADGQKLFALEENDEVVITNAEHLIPFVELEENYFFKSLTEKFRF